MIEISHQSPAIFASHVATYRGVLFPFQSYSLLWRAMDSSEKATPVNARRSMACGRRILHDGLHQGIWRHGKRDGNSRAGVYIAKSDGPVFDGVVVVIDIPRTSSLQSVFDTCSVISDSSGKPERPLSTSEEITQVSCECSSRKECVVGLNFAVIILLLHCRDCGGHLIMCQVFHNHCRRVYPRGGRTELRSSAEDRQRMLGVCGEI
jgi:hypothetical protein